MGMEKSLQTTVKMFDHAICLRVIGGCSVDRGAKNGSKMEPMEGSEVTPPVKEMSRGRLNQVTQVRGKAWAHTLAEILGSRKASGQRVRWSITVKRCVKLEKGARGLTMSTWM